MGTSTNHQIFAESNPDPVAKSCSLNIFHGSLYIYDVELYSRIGIS